MSNRCLLETIEISKLYSNDARKWTALCLHNEVLTVSLFEISLFELVRIESRINQTGRKRWTGRQRTEEENDVFVYCFWTIRGWLRERTMHSFQSTDILNCAQLASVKEVSLSGSNHLLSNNNGFGHVTASSLICRMIYFSSFLVCNMRWS